MRITQNHKNIQLIQVTAKKENRNKNGWNKQNKKRKWEI